MPSYWQAAHKKSASSRHTIISHFLIQHYSLLFTYQSRARSTLSTLTPPHTSTAVISIQACPGPVRQGSQKGVCGPCPHVCHYCAIFVPLSCHAAHIFSCHYCANCAMPHTYSAAMIVPCHTHVQLYPFSCHATHIQHLLAKLQVLSRHPHFHSFTVVVKVGQKALHWV